MEGKINQKSTISATLSSGGGGSSDHKRLVNRDLPDQHPIIAITGLQEALDNIENNKATKADYEALRTQLISHLADIKAKGLYYDLEKKFSKKSFWYLTSEVDPVTNQGNPGIRGEYIVSGPYDLGQGGGGSGGGGSGGGVTTVTLSNKDPLTNENYWPAAVAVGATVSLKVNWSSLRDGDPTGNGTMFVYVNDILVSKKTVKQGDYECDVSAYLNSGANKIEFKVQDAYSTVKNLIGNLTAVSLKLTSSFEDDVSYTGLITYTYVPIGDVLKTVHFLVDGVDIGQDRVRTTGEQCNHVLPVMSHGAHTLEVYFTAVLDDELVESNRLTYDLICYEAGNLTPIIASTFPAQSEQEQYVSFNIRYRAYTPGKNTSIINLVIDGQPYGEPLTVGLDWQNWEVRPTVAGNHIYMIQTGSVSRTFNAHVSESAVNVEPVTTGQVLALSTFGRSNAESLDSRLRWEDAAHNIQCNLSGFNWSSNGWIQDESGATVLRLSGDARVEIPYQPFYKDLQQTGKTIEIEFATTDVKKYESRIFECLTGGDSLTYSYTLAGEDDRAHYFTVTDVNNATFVDAVKGDHGTYLFIYNGENWVLDGEVVDLGENNIYGITIRLEDRAGTPSNYFENGDRITVAYEVVGRGIYITPQLAKFQSQLSSLSTQYKENERVRLAFVIEKRTENRLIYMYINGIMSGVARYPLGDTFEQNPAANITLGSNDATLDIYNIRIYDNSLTRKQVVNNWIADMRDPIEKAVYYQDNDNFDETGKVIIEKLPSKTPYMVLTGSDLPAYKKDKKFVDVEFVYPGSDERYFTSEQAQIDVQGTSSQYYYRKNFKINFKNGFYDINGEENKKYKFIPPLSKKEKKFTFKADVASSEGANNVELVRYFELTKNFYMPAELDQDPDDTVDGYETKDRVRTGIDGFPIIMFHDDGNGAKFYGKMNFNNDKDNKDTFGFTDGDECWEFINNTTPLVLFQNDDLSSWESSFESRYPEDYGDDEHPYGTQVGELDKLQTMISWVVSTRRLPTDSEDEKTRKLNKFKNELTRYFNLQSSLFYYLYTELFLMVDSRAKNAMVAYLRSHKPGDGGDRWFWLPYDMDTAIGTNNEGLLVFNYDAEDTDIVNGANVYNGQESVFWNNLRDAFGPELKQLYADLRSGNAGGDMSWSYPIIEKLFEDHQAYWSASIFNEDSYTKYLEPLIKTNDATYLGMAQGSKEEQRKWWLWNRFRYLDSKYRTGDAKGQNIMLRAYQRDNITVTPYINCYVTGVFDQAVDDLMITVDAQKDTAYTIVPPEHWDPAGSDSVVIIYSADMLRDIGDISGLKPGYADFSAATKLQRLQIGSTAPGYTNNKLETLNVGNNHLLTYIDARNCSALGTGETKVVDLSNCNSIEECYFDNTNIQGVNFPVGGNLKKVHLPASITDLTIRNHPNLTELVLAGTNKLSSVWLEDIPSSSISAISIINAMPEGSSARLININETVEDISVVSAIYDKLWTMKGKDNKGDTTDRAQITGVIHIPDTAPVAYAEWKRLTDMFPEVKIDAIIICTVSFWNENTLHFATNVISGRDVDPSLVTMPRKTSTQQYYYVFTGWDAAFTNVTTDLNIHAIFEPHIQVYRTTFDIRSNTIQFNPEYVDADWNTLIAEPTIVQETVPDGVNFLGWFTQDNIRFNFLTDTITDHIILYARWQDENVPVVTLTRTAYNKFAYHATDNLGVSGWLVNTSGEEPDLEDANWHEIEPLTVFDGEYTIDSAGDYYFYVKDDQGNISFDKITATSIEFTQNINNDQDDSTDIIRLALSENGQPVNTEFALVGTTFTFNAAVDQHYEGLVVYYNSLPILLNSEIVVGNTAEIVAEVLPKSYTVTFDNRNWGTTPAAQTVVYKHLVDTPAPQVVNGFILDYWFTQDEISGQTTWNFGTNVVLDDITLYAAWVEYADPTRITLEIPLDNYEVTVNIQQLSSGSAKVNWGDGSDVANIAESGYVEYHHIYETAGTYTIGISRYQGDYRLGKNYDIPVIQPISLVTDVQFAYDVAYTNPGAFRDAVNLSTLRLTRFMTAIADYTFMGCDHIGTYTSGVITLPDSIQTIGANAFQGCTDIEILSLPAKLQSLGEDAFRECTGLTTVTFTENCPLTRISTQAFFVCSNLETINIPNNVTTIKSNAFKACSSLNNIILGRNVTTIEAYAFADCVSLDNLTIQATDMISMDVGCFNGCTLLQSAGPITGNYNLKFAWNITIPEHAFDDHRHLTTIVIPNTIKTISDSAFYNCRAISSITLPNGLRTIGYHSFYYCSNLAGIDVPGSVLSIGNGAFAQCRSLRTVNLRLPSSTNTVDDPGVAGDTGWFAQANASNIDIHIPAIIPIDEAGEAYGPYWNLHSKNNDGTYNFLDFTNDLY